jgi:hypothetical protein
VELAEYTVVEQLTDGRQLVEPAGRRGVLVVVGVSTLPPVAARMGYGRTRTPIAVRPTRPAHEIALRARIRERAELHHAVERRLREEAEVPARRSMELFLSLLDDAQREQWRAHQRCWVPTRRGPVRLGVIHDLRFRPAHRPAEEWSLCVVPNGRPLPLGDVWTNLLLVLAADPDAFFRVANIRGKGRPSRPDPP